MTPSNLAAGALRAFVVVFVLGSVLSWPCTGFAATFGTWAGAPSLRLVVPLVAFVAVATFGGGARRPWFRLGAALCLGFAWSTHRVLTMGDGHWWRVATAEGTVGYSEPLSSLAHAMLFRAFGPQVLEWISPVAGVAATVAWLAATDASGVTAGATPRVVHGTRALAALCWASCGATALFFHRYVEHTQLGVWLMMLGVARLSRWSADVARLPGPDGPRVGGLVPGTSLVVAAALFHLVYAAVAAAALGAAALLAHRARRGRRFLLDGAGVAASVAVLLGATFAAFAIAPVSFVTGSVAGGSDGRLLVPFVGDDGRWFAPGTLLAADHLALVAHVVVTGAPLLVALCAAWTLRRGREGMPQHALVPLAGTAAWLCFVALFGFDLGWPNDADLMLAMSPVAALLVFVVAAPAVATARPAPRAVLLLLAGAAVASTWCVIAPLVRPADARLSARNTPAAALFVEEHEALARDGEAGVGPFHVRVHAGDVVTLRAEGPAGATFLVGRGAPSIACQGHPYGDVLDIEVSNAIQPEELIFGGVFDATGVARTTWTVSALPDGRMPGIQMLVLQPAPGRTSAAWYFERR